MVWPCDPPVTRRLAASINEGLKSADPATTNSCRTTDRGILFLWTPLCAFWTDPSVCSVFGSPVSLRVASSLSTSHNDSPAEEDLRPEETMETPRPRQHATSGATEERRLLARWTERFHCLYISCWMLLCARFVLGFHLSLWIFNVWYTDQCFETEAICNFCSENFCI